MIWCFCSITQSCFFHCLWPTIWYITEDDCSYWKHTLNYVNSMILFVLYPRHLERRLAHGRISIYIWWKNEWVNEWKNKQINESSNMPALGNECIYVGDNILPLSLWGPLISRKVFTQPVSGSYCCITKFPKTNGLKQQSFAHCPEFQELTEMVCLCSMWCQQRLEHPRRILHFCVWCFRISQIAEG